MPVGQPWACRTAGSPRDSHSSALPPVLSCMAQENLGPSNHFMFQRTVSAWVDAPGVSTWRDQPPLVVPCSVHPRALQGQVLPSSPALARLAPCSSPQADRRCHPRCWPPPALAQVGRLRQAPEATLDTRDSVPAPRPPSICCSPPGHELLASEPGHHRVAHQDRAAKHESWRDRRCEAEMGCQGDKGFMRPGGGRLLD